MHSGCRKFILLSTSTYAGVVRPWYGSLRHEGTKSIVRVPWGRRGNPNLLGHPIDPLHVGCHPSSPVNAHVIGRIVFFEPYLDAPSWVSFNPSIDVPNGGLVLSLSVPPPPSSMLWFVLLHGGSAHVVCRRIFYPRPPVGRTWMEGTFLLVELGAFPGDGTHASSLLGSWMVDPEITCDPGVGVDSIQRPWTAVLTIHVSHSLTRFGSVHTVFVGPGVSLVLPAPYASSSVLVFPPPDPPHLPGPFLPVSNRTPRRRCSSTLLAFLPRFSPSFPGPFLPIRPFLAAVRTLPRVQGVPGDVLRNFVLPVRDIPKHERGARARLTPPFAASEGIWRCVETRRRAQADRDAPRRKERRAGGDAKEGSRRGNVTKDGRGTHAIRSPLRCRGIGSDRCEARIAWKRSKERTRGSKEGGTTRDGGIKKDAEG